MTDITSRGGIMTSILSILNTVVKSKYFYIVIVIGIIIFMGIRIHLLKDTVADRDTTILTLKKNIENLRGNIEVLEQTVSDKEEVIISANKILTSCYEQNQKQINEMLEIDSIMTMCDNGYQVTTTNTESKSTGGENHVSKATYSKGIDFINSTFDDIK